MDGYITTKKASDKWGISQRQAQNHCENDTFSVLSQQEKSISFPFMQADNFVGLFYV